MLAYKHTGHISERAENIRKTQYLQSKLSLCIIGIYENFLKNRDYFSEYLK